MKHVPSKPPRSPHESSESRRPTPRSARTAGTGLAVALVATMPRRDGFAARSDATPVREHQRLPFARDRQGRAPGRTVVGSTAWPPYRTATILRAIRTRVSPASVEHHVGIDEQQVLAVRGARRSVFGDTSDVRRRRSRRGFAVRCSRDRGNAATVPAVHRCHHVDLAATGCGCVGRVESAHHTGLVWSGDVLRLDPRPWERASCRFGAAETAARSRSREPRFVLVDRGASRSTADEDHRGAATPTASARNDRNARRPVEETRGRCRAAPGSPVAIGRASRTKSTVREAQQKYASSSTNRSCGAKRERTYACLVRDVFRKPATGSVHTRLTA